jgi:hypothetical protein
MKTALIFLALSIVALIVRSIYGWWTERKFYLGCGVHLHFASDANSVERMRDELYTALMYAYENGFVNGNTSVFLYNPHNNIDVWYGNILVAHKELMAVPEDASILERNIVFDIVRKSVKDDCKPARLEYYPAHKTMFWSGVVITISLCWSIVALVVQLIQSMA